MNPRDISKIKAETKVPIFGHIGDLHNDAGIKCARIWLSSIDVVFHSNIEMAEVSVKRLLYLPYTCSVGRYYPVEEKNIPVFFSGVANIPRLWYILTVTKFADAFLSNSRINFFKSSDRTSKSFLDQDEYDSIIRHSFSVLDLTHHSRLQQGTSGRMFQAMAAESVLIAEECNALNKLLKPFVEYLPFRNGIELKYALILLREEPDLCKSIATHGLRKFQEHHSPQKIWPQIIHKAKLYDYTYKRL